MKNKLLIKNTVMLYLMTFTKMLLPLITLPYLTRILSTSNYGVVSYTKSIMTYMQIIVDFGFMLSITKEIVNNKNDQNKVSELCSDTLLSRLLLWIMAFVVLGIMICNITILKHNIIFVILSMFSVLTTCFLPDYLFRGFENMEVISYRFIVSKLISTVLTFIFVKSNDSMMWIPILDILGNLAAILLTNLKIKKMNIHINIDIKRLKFALLNIKASTNYFASNLASTLLGAFSTILIGVYLTASDVAFWSIANNLIGTIQSLYNPISDGIYPQMIKSKSIGLIKNIFKLLIPLIITGCIISYFLAPQVINLLSGPKYGVSVTIFRMLIPILFLGFISIMLGWPTLGAINKSKETMITAILSATVQMISFLLLIITNSFTIWNIALVRILCEIVLLSSRFGYVLKYRNEFERGD